MSNSFYKNLLLQSPVGYAYHKVVLNTSGDVVDYIFLEVNDAFEQITGLDAEYIVNKSVSAIQPDIRLSKNDWVALYGKIALNGGETTFEQYIQNSQQWYNIYVSSPEKGYFTTIYTEVCQKCNTIGLNQQAHEQLLQSEQKFRNLFETMRQGVVYQNLDGSIISANKAAQEILGLNIDQMQGRKSIDPRWRAIHEDGSDFPGDTHPAMVTIKTGKPQHNVIMGVFNPKYEKYSWISIDSHPEYILGTNKLLRVFATFVDITSFKEIQNAIKESEKNLQTRNQEYEAINEELRQTNEELMQTNDELFAAKERAEESDKLKTAFLQNMSHEIRTPMNAICGFADMLNRKDLTDEKRQSFVDIINSSSNQLLNIINDLLSMSVIENENSQLNIGEVPINSKLITLLAAFKPMAAKQNIMLYCKQQLPDHQALIMTDETKLNQVLSNLINNAIKFTHKGYIEFGYELVEKNLLFYVKDTGIGIEADKHDIIFERFRQADTSVHINYGGTGLGLAISKAYVEMLGGKIWLQSQKGIGTTFYFTIPFTTPASNNTEIVHPKQEHKKTILIAEDEQYNYLYLEELLLQMNFNILHAKNGAEAVELCKQFNNIDLVLMDIKMPIMSGDEATQIIKQLRPSLPVVAQTAYGLEADRKRFAQISFDEYINKPVKTEILKNIVQKLLKNIE